MSRIISGLFTTTYNQLDSSETEGLRGKLQTANISVNAQNSS